MNGVPSSACSESKMSTQSPAASVTLLKSDFFAPIVLVWRSSTTSPLPDTTVAVSCASCDCAGCAGSGTGAAAGSEPAGCGAVRAASRRSLSAASYSVTRSAWILAGTAGTVQYFQVLLVTRHVKSVHFCEFEYETSSEVGVTPLLPWWLPPLEVLPPFGGLPRVVTRGMKNCNGNTVFT